ncbi:RNA-binding protein [Pseudoalteromonas phenolica]|uniref:RNA recognition motif domain-containing protein n=1 Tax=Pseudoalteromonas phenolica TaxID=161398 RepID=UPI00110BFE29|nr:RNA-binding protein [Pseudoalteromonas phenolica]TMN90722.1 RNA-binding protein [Pseudoalteromonas phenolica]
MNPTQQKSLFIVLAIAIIGYFAANALLADSSLNLGATFSIGTLIGGFIATVMSASNVTPKSDNAEVKTKTLYVGNLPYKANESVVRELFSEQGRVFNVRLLKDKNTGKRRGFGFVEMAEADADKAIAALNEKEFQQRTLKVRAAKQKPETSEEAVAS